MTSKQVLMSAKGHARAAAELAQFDGLDIICLNAGGVFTRNGTAIADRKSVV